MHCASVDTLAMEARRLRRQGHITGDQLPPFDVGESLVLRFLSPSQDSRSPSPSLGNPVTANFAVRYSNHSTGQAGLDTD